ncbi:Lipoteichoic acid synthase [Aedoeadaptatus ivorii]|uniref:Lipoteichoic acid synthase n=1 Tax=Aedoeadaptatus ivorii TaxID=54006 RepID=A0A3S4Y7T5_9FIRM|nr:sulfatase-like hydrolase/transferase [Peptoniphilus ivorii]MDQ0508851.1 phosphoglycerol transferase MdoB-like AlkP superfamily enzyme/glycerophosphoryl diester phosphodiesterase [Peptoniphilus ivorii]VEJ36029.1 Lipoteichoic acid synthase [Peptoniphilus ivorii]
MRKIVQFVILWAQNFVLYATMAQTEAALSALSAAMTAAFEYGVLTALHTKKKLAATLGVFGMAAKLALHMYYRYYGSFPDIYKMTQVTYLKDVKEVVLELIHPLYPLYLALGIAALVFILRDADAPKKRISPACFVAAAALYGILLALPGTDYGLYSGAARQMAASLSDYGRAQKVASLVAEEDDLAAAYPDLLTRLDHKNAYTGIGSGKNLLVIQVESLQNDVIGKRYKGQEITPHLNALIRDRGSLYFTDYMQMLGLGNSSDAEFVSLFSLYPNNRKGAYSLYADKDLYGLIDMAKNRGYDTFAMHGYRGDFYHRDAVYPKLGFDEIDLGESYAQDDKMGMGLSDGSFFRQSAEKLIQRRGADADPFFGFMITLSSHTPFYCPDKYKALEIDPSIEGHILGNYLNAIHYTDEALGQFLDELDRAGILENTVVALYGDHFAMTKNDPEQTADMTAFNGRPYDYDDMMNIPLIVHVPGADIRETVKTTGSQLDFLPTIANIMGWNDEIAVLFGRDLLEPQTEEHRVLQQTYMLKGSYLSQAELFEITRDGHFANSRYIDRTNRKPLAVKTAAEKSDAAKETIDLSNALCETDRIGEMRRAAMEGTERLDAALTVMHAGGTIDGMRYTNFKETLDKEYAAGKRYFEIDLSETTDDRLVCIHSWDGYTQKFFGYGGSEETPVSRAEFLALKERHGYTQMDLSMLLDWFRAHKDAYLITDIKTDNVRHLVRDFADVEPALKARILPQIYAQSEYAPVRQAGFEKILYTLYLSGDTPQEVAAFYDAARPYAITVSEQKAEAGYADVLRRAQIPYYVHTVNDADAAKAWIKKGAIGVYTDRL